MVLVDRIRRLRSHPANGFISRPTCDAAAGRADDPVRLRPQPARDRHREGKRPRRIVNNIPDGWIGVEEDLPEPGKLNENTLDYQKYMCLVQVVEGKSADARPLAFTENQRWVNGNVDMTDYVSSNQYSSVIL